MPNDNITVTGTAWQGVRDILLFYFGTGVFGLG